MAVLGSYVFGTFYVFQFRFQGGINVFGHIITIPIQFLNMLPFVATLLFLVMWSVLLGRSKVKRVIGAPSSLTVPFIED